jgi:serine/threonine protein kinase
MAEQLPPLFLRRQGARESLLLGEEINGGEFGDVYACAGAHQDLAVKIYKRKTTAVENETKIGWMINLRPPLIEKRHNGRAYYQLAWPNEKVFDGTGTFIGFTMPKVDTSNAVNLEWLMSDDGISSSNIPIHYSFRLHVAWNLALVFDSLHDSGVSVIDVKPDNILFYKDTGYVCLLDCDSFIPSDASQPAVGAGCTPGYILPEARRGANDYAPDEFREEQDRFALALLIFRLMNQGVHPFMGKILDRSIADRGLDLQERIDHQFYAYGLRPSSTINAAAQSRHEWFDDETRRLFDRAFGSRSRPSAKEWADHLARYVGPGATDLMKCARKPDEHVHFGKGCGACVAEEDLRRLKSRRKQGAPPLQAAGQPTPGLQAGPFAQLPVQQGNLRVPVRASNTVWLVIAALGVVGILLLMLGRSGGIGTPKSAPVPTTQWSSGIVWKAPDGADQAIKECRDWDCFFGVLARFSAPAETVAFLRAEQQIAPTKDIGYPISFHGRGGVKAVEIFYPGLGMEGVTEFVFANGADNILRPKDDFDRISGSSAAYQQFRSSYPKVTPWDGMDYVNEVNASDGSQQFQFKQTLLNGCHACSVLGTLKLGYNFDASGHFTGMVILGIDPDKDVAYGAVHDELAEKSALWQPTLVTKADGSTETASSQTQISDNVPPYSSPKKCRFSINLNPNMTSGWFLLDQAFNINNVSIQRGNLTELALPASVPATALTIQCNNAAACISPIYSDQRGTQASVTAAALLVSPENADTVVSDFQKMQSICGQAASTP